MIKILLILRTVLANHPKTGGIVHDSAFNVTPRFLGSILGTLPGKPPPVMCAKAFIKPNFTAGNTVRQ